MIYKALCTFQVEAKRLIEDTQQTEKRDIYFTTNTEEITLVTYREITQQWAQQLSVDIDEWVENGSGFNITNIVRAHCTFIIYDDEFGGGVADIPDKFYAGGKLIHVINTPIGSQSCLQTCLNIIRNGAKEIAKTTVKLRKLPGIIIDWNELGEDPKLEECMNSFPEPFHVSNIPAIAKILNLEFNVFRLDNKVTENAQKHIHTNNNL